MSWQSAAGRLMLTYHSFRMENGKHHDHTSIQSKWDGVLNQADNLLSHRPFRNGDPDWDDCLDNFVSSLKEGASTSEGRSTIMQAVAPRRPSAMSSDWQSILSKAADSGVADVDDPREVKVETAIPRSLGGNVLPKTLDLVDVCLCSGKYAEAAGYQQRAMEYRQMFAGDTPVPTEVMCRDEMKLADIYRRIGIPKWMTVAEEILLSVIDRLKTEGFDDPGMKNHLLAHLYHDLGRICLDLNKLGVGSRHLTNAFELMVDSFSAPMPLLRSVGTMLYRIYISTDKPEVASSLDEHAEARCGFSLKTLAWCQEQGFDTEHETFKFDRCDTRPESRVKGLSPIHVAAKSAEDEVLRYMLTSRRLNLEVLEHQDNATPFLLACSQQDIVIVDLLFQYGARATARDKLHRNGLHLCQRGTGGTGVARRLLSLPGVLDINAMDSYQNTALHLAASMGNSKMVMLLLSLRANPDTRGPGGYTPLMAAVQATMKNPETKLEVLRELVKHGADASLEDSSGQTAADIANDGQVRKALKAWAKPRQNVKPARRFTIPWKS